jgi:hypothetical protein
VTDRDRDEAKGDDAIDADGRDDRRRRIMPRLRRRQGIVDDFSVSTPELVLRGALVYLVFGVVYIGTHIELLDQLEHQLSGPFTVFGDYAALAVMVTAWPLLLGSALICGVSACGVI